MGQNHISFPLSPAMLIMAEIFSKCSRHEAQEMMDGGALEHFHHGLKYVHRKHKLKFQLSVSVNLDVSQIGL